MAGGELQTFLHADIEKQFEFILPTTAKKFHTWLSSAIDDLHFRLDSPFGFDTLQLMLRAEFSLPNNETSHYCIIISAALGGIVFAENKDQWGNTIDSLSKHFQAELKPINDTMDFVSIDLCEVANFEIREISSERIQVLVDVLEVGFIQDFFTDIETNIERVYGITSTNYLDNKLNHNVKPHKPGRPSHPEDIWVIEELRAGRNNIEVKREWLGKPEVIARALIDPERQFKRLEKRAKMTK